MSGRIDFPTTHWSLVGEAGKAAGELKRHALSSLLRKYLPPLKAYLVYAKKLDSQRADDLLQSFVADQVLEREILRHAEMGRGRFRAFLITALDRYVSNQRRFETAKKRSPRNLRQIDDALQVPDGNPSPAEFFDLMWTREILAQAIGAMRAHCIQSRPLLWQVFTVRVLDPALNGVQPLPYERLVEELGFTSPSQAANAVVTANRMFGRMLRSVLSAYISDPEEVEEEMRALRATVAAFAARRRVAKVSNVHGCGED